MQNDNIETRSMLPVGTVLNGKYRIERYLASGGFGNTYAAYNVFLEEEVAVKEFYIRGVTQRDGDSVSVSVSNDENLTQFIDQKAKFMKEARRLRRLKNDHIVRVHDLFEENGTAYYIMDFVNGESLSSRLKRTGQPIGEQETLNILGQVLDALAVVHQQGIFHLDIKPANIMVDHEGNALLIDFGASKQMRQDGRATASSGLCYTPGYAPIEQMAQNYAQFGPWTDIYSLGASLYYMLTLHPLPSPADLLENEMLLQMDASISPRTQQLVRRMMAPVRTQRPQSVAEVKCLLAEKVIDNPTQMVTKPEPPSEMTKTIAQPKPVLPEPQPQSQIKLPPIPQPEPQPDSVYTPEPLEDSPSSRSKLWWCIGVGAAGLAFAVIVVSLFLPKTSSTVFDTSPRPEKIVPIVDDDDIIAVDTTPRADETITENGVNQYADYKRIYQNTLNEFIKKQNDSEYSENYYFLYDITGDGIPELWIDVDDGDGWYSHVLYVYMANDGKAKCIYNGNSGHPGHHGYYYGKGYIIDDFAHMGYVARYRFEYKNGRLNKVELFNGEQKDITNYKDVTERNADTYELIDKEGLK